MKILDIINTDHSAKELLWYRAAVVEGWGHENHIMCSSGPWVQRMRSSGTTVHVVDTPRSIRPVALLVSLWKLINLLRHERYDIVHSHGSVLGVLGRCAGLFVKVRVVHTVHGFHFHEGMSPVRQKVFELSERALGAMSDLILSQNQEDHRVLALWNDVKKVRLIGNGIRLPTPRELAWDRGCGGYQISCIARFERVKNHEMLFEAIRLVLDRGVNLDLHCFGDGERLEQMKSLVSELGIEGNVHFEGYVEEVAPRMRLMDLNVLTSVKEGLPRALIEASALGVPSVATDVKGSREVIVDGVTGHLIPLGNVQAFADAVYDLLTTQETLEGFAQAGIERAQEVFDEDAVCGRMVDLYTELMHRPQES